MGLGMWMTSCPEAMGWDSWVFWKNSSLLRFGPRRVQLFAAGCEGVGCVSELRADAGRTVSIVKIVSLSPMCRKPKRQEGNKSFVPEPRESSVFRVFFGFLCVWTFYACEQCTDMYILRIRILAVHYIICGRWSCSENFAKHANPHCKQLKKSKCYWYWVFKLEVANEKMTYVTSLPVATS